MLVFGIIIMCSSSSEENSGAIAGSCMLLILGINFLLGPVWVYSIAEENKEKKNKKTSGGKRDDLQEAGKDPVEAIKKNFREIADQFKSIEKK